LIAEPNHFDRVTAEALGHRAAVVQRRGRVHEALALQEAAIGLAAAGGWAELELRLRYNLAVTLVEDDPRRANEIMREVLALSERIGHTPWYMRAAGTVADITINEAEDWDAALALIDDGLARSGDSPDFSLVMGDLLILAARDRPIDDTLPQLDRLDEDPHLRANITHLRATLSLTQGDFHAARGYAERTRELDETGESELIALDSLILASAWLGDVEGLRAAADAVRAVPNAGAQAAVSCVEADAAIAALEGRAAESSRLFEQSFADLERLTRVLDSAIYRLTAIRVLPDAPEAATWAADARAIFERVGAVAWLRQLDELAERHGIGSAPPTTRPDREAAPAGELAPPAA
jgi:hypothetical protein